MATVEEQVRRRLPVAERRELIVEAAGRLFGERGYDGTRLDDIAAAAGVTKPILYRHFDSKRELYLALLARHRDDLPSFLDAIPEVGSPQERLRVVVEVWLTYVEEHAYAWRMLFRDTGGGPEIDAFRGESRPVPETSSSACFGGWGAEESRTASWSRLPSSCAAVWPRSSFGGWTTPVFPARPWSMA